LGNHPRVNRSTNPLKQHRFPPAIIRYAVRLYHRFNLSRRDIENLLAERRHYLWRVVDQDGDVVDVYLQARRNAGAATASPAGH
jgi:putative transposase